jgi:hypothetical protein
MVASACLADDGVNSTTERAAIGAGHSTRLAGPHQTLLRKSPFSWTLVSTQTPQSRAENRARASVVSHMQFPGRPDSRGLKAHRIARGHLGWRHTVALRRIAVALPRAWLTAELDDVRARRLRVGRRLLTLRNAAASGSTRVSARLRPDQASGAKLN